MTRLNGLLSAVALGLVRLAFGLGVRSAQPFDKPIDTSRFADGDFAEEGGSLMLADPGPEEKAAVASAKEQCRRPDAGRPNLENGVIAYLVTRSSDVVRLKESVPRLTYHFLRRWSYPVKVFIPSEAMRKYDPSSFWESPSYDTVHQVMSEFAGAVHDWEIVYFDVKFPKVITDDPEWTRKMNRCASKVSTSYKHMNQFFTKAMYEHPAMAKYRYYLRIDADFNFNADLVEDPFCMMAKTGRKFMWQTRKLIKEKKCSEGLFEWFKEYADTHGLTAQDPVFFSPWGATVNYVGYAGMGDLDFFRSERVRKLAEALNEDGRVYLNRWSDQTYYPLLFGLLENHSAVGEIGFDWPGDTWCHKCPIPAGKFNPETGKVE